MPGRHGLGIATCGRRWSPAHRAKLDLTMMRKAIRFNHRNEWHFDTQYQLENERYAFAFSDWRFDRQGFPREEGETAARTGRN